MTIRTLAVLPILAGVLIVGGCGHSRATPTRTTAPPPRTATSPPTLTAAIPSPPRRPPRRSRPPGTLPQTRALPSARTVGFRAEMRALWRAVLEDSVRSGRSAFFPEAAYIRLKAVADPAGDFTHRLLADFALDLSAAHALIGRDGAAARLVGVRVPVGYAHWVAAGVCANRTGYYEVPNARVLYTLAGRLHSFGIASMISWRGVWYVVHLGAVVRSTPEGIVDDPAPGAGLSAPSSTC